VSLHLFKIADFKALQYFFMRTCLLPFTSCSIVSKEEPALGHLEKEEVALERELAL
jgi:hypothetical protein